MKKTLFMLSGAALLAVMILVQGAVTYPPASTGNTTVITNVTIITNVDVIITTNLTVNQKAAIKVLTTLETTATNGFYTGTNSWSGPTNPLPLHLSRQRYVTYTPIHITGVTSKSNTVVEQGILSVSNAATTNVLCTFSGFTSPAFTNQYTASNQSTVKIWWEYDPSGPDTNIVFRQTK